MGQTFELINVDREEKSYESCAKLGEFFFDDFRDLRAALRLPTLPREVGVWLKRGEVALQPGPFGKLSPEVIDMVYAQFTSEDDLDDVIWFAITCKRLLTIGKPHLLRLLRAIHAPWAGSRIICLGEYTDDDSELPAGFLTDAEKHKIATTEIDGVGEPDEYSKCLSLYACELYRKSYGRGRSRDDEWAYWGELREAREMYRKDGDAQGLLELDMFNALYRYTKPTYPAGVAVLCNLSKAEFGLINGLMARICWATDPSISLCCGKAYEERFVKGPWAGDRFCITTVKEMGRLKIGAGKEWKDVTEEVDELLVHLWKKNLVDDA
ncbi:hypothetical protein C8Q76DRAFT_364549 [Earliella scabrosa]|nr:hypothetical protein C8Q76DRAFT_364549 [Earliella scabrosa]